MRRKGRTSTEKPKNRRGKGNFLEKYVFIFIILSFILLLYTLIKTAWVCDDAYITFRTIDNFVNGYGLRYNVVERVQAFTHPLWLFIVTIPYFVFRDAFYTPIIISILVTLFIVIFFYKRFSISKFNSFLFILFLLTSKAFIDYSTSGLENAVSHLLAVLFIFVYVTYELNDKKIFILSLLVAFVGLNRVDSVLLYLPALLLCIFNSNYKKNLLLAFYGLLPFICWTLFSILYYGYPFPNTFYAKLYTGIPLSDFVIQGFHYYVNSIRLDPVTLIVVFSCIVYVFYKRRKDYYVLMVGLILYLVYIVYIGGDFMSGRFFTLPFIFSLVIILRELSLSDGKYKYGIVVGLIAVMLLMPNSSIMSGEDYSEVGGGYSQNKGICDERGYYYRYASLWRAIKGEVMLDPKFSPIKEAEDWKKWQQTIYLVGAIGYFGYYIGPSVYILDIHCLTDPFRSKLNVDKEEIIYSDWRVGHYVRPIPSGYTLSILKQQNLLDNSDLYNYYSIILNITQGDIFFMERIVDIFKMNFGFYNKYIKKYNDEIYDEMIFYTDLIRYNPINKYYCVIRGNYYMENKRYREAMRDYAIYLINIDGDNATICYKFAQCLYYEKEYNRAYECLKEAKSLKPNINLDPAFEKNLEYIINNQNK